MKIPKKNYIVSILIIIATILSVLLIRDKYLEQKEYDSMTNERIDFMFEIKEDELESYLMENREVVIYMASSSDESIVNFELSLKDYVLKQQLGKDMVYINLNNVSNKFLDKLKDKYFSDELKNSDISLGNYPNMLIVENGVIVSAMYTKEKTINIDDAKKYLNKYIDEVL